MLPLLIPFHSGESIKVVFRQLHPLLGMFSLSQQLVLAWNDFLILLVTSVTIAEVV
jgi:hypothetical protein